MKYACGPLQTFPPLSILTWKFSSQSLRMFSFVEMYGQTYPFRLLIRVDTTLSTCCEVAVDLEGVPRAALVWINPVFTCRQEAKRKTFRGENRTFGEWCKAVDRTFMYSMSYLGPFLSLSSLRPRCSRRPLFIIEA
uniref:Uncharacterized protein n=1 Tax=Xiphophorus maculatus TaxID=8083 RepID=A0A3B5Q0G1_XIPMA